MGAKEPITAPPANPDRLGPRWRAGPHTFEGGPRTLVMGVLNVTPDSFSDGGRFVGPQAAVAHGIEMVVAGADIVDVGGESTRPGAETVPTDEEAARVLPVIERLAALGRVAVSIDTRKPEVAVAALAAGATIVNDVTGGADPGMFAAVAPAGAAMVLMHMRGDPSTMTSLTHYEDVVEEVRASLADRLHAAVAAGIELERLAIDPGLGFAKTGEQSLVLMRDIARFHTLGRPVLAGPSRKSFIGTALGGLPVEERLEGTAAAVAWLVGQGVQVIRVHDVPAMVRVIRVAEAIREGRFLEGGA